MKKLVLLLSILMLAFGASAMAQTVFGQGDGDFALENIVDTNSDCFAYPGQEEAAVSEDWWDATRCVGITERVRVKIGEAIALHLSEDEWNLNVYNDTADLDEDYVHVNSAGDSSSGRYEEGCYFVPRTLEFADGARGFTEGYLSAFDAYESDTGLLEGMNRYPAIKTTGDLGGSELTEKGYLLCLNSKFFQVYSNTGSWQLKAWVQQPGDVDGGFGQFLISSENANHQPEAAFGERVIDDSLDIVINERNTTTGMDWSKFTSFTGELVRPLIADDRSGTPNGWYDGEITEAFFFDGTETAGTYNINVTFRLFSPIPTLAGL